MPAPPDVSTEGCRAPAVEAPPNFNPVELLQEGQTMNTNSTPSDGAKLGAEAGKTTEPAELVLDDSIWRGNPQEHPCPDRRGHRQF